MLEPTGNVLVDLKFINPPGLSASEVSSRTSNTENLYGSVKPVRSRCGACAEGFTDALKPDVAHGAHEALEHLRTLLPELVNVSMSGFDGSHWGV